MRNSRLSASQEIGLSCVEGIPRMMRYVGTQSAQSQAVRELELLQQVRVSEPSAIDRGMYEFLYCHASALAQFAQEALHQSTE